MLNITKSGISHIYTLFIIINLDASTHYSLDMSANLNVHRDTFFFTFVHNYYEINLISNTKFLIQSRSPPTCSKHQRLSDNKCIHHQKEDHLKISQRRVQFSRTKRNSIREKEEKDERTHDIETFVHFSLVISQMSCFQLANTTFAECEVPENQAEKKKSPLPDDDKRDGKELGGRS